MKMRDVQHFYFSVYADEKKTRIRVFIKICVQYELGSGVQGGAMYIMTPS